MLTQVTKQTWIRSAIVSLICIILFIFINGVFSDSITNEESEKITKSKAIQIAETFIEEQTGATVTKSDIVYDSPKHYTGYLEQQGVTKQHYEKTDKVYPVEKFRVFALLDNIDREVYVDINFATGDVTGWSFPLDEQLIIDEASKAAVLDALKEHHFPVENLKLELTDNGRFVASNADALQVTDAIINVNVEAIELNGQPFISFYEPESLVPADYTAHTSKQDKLANLYTNIGFIGLTIVMAILAIIYAFIYRHFTSFKYGLVFTLVATILSCIAQMSMMKPILMLQENTMQHSDFMLIFMNVFVVVYVLISAVSFYFSFVAGDGLWKAQGFNLWPRFKEESFGKTLWNSMLLGYLFALSGLGIQALIFEGLSYAIGTYSAIDATQSPLNTTMMWFFPALAWVAAITEEAVYRYFGVGIFRRWFKNTYAAAIIPSLVWAFGHTLYPLYPVSTRIIELLLIGILLTWVMVKFGLLTVIFTHAMFNTIAMTMSLFVYGESFDIVMGVLYIVMPIIVAFIIKAAHAKYIKNRPTPPSVPPIENPNYYQPYMTQQTNEQN